MTRAAASENAETLVVEQVMPRQEQGVGSEMVQVSRTWRGSLRMDNLKERSNTPSVVRLWEDSTMAVKTKTETSTSFFSSGINVIALIICSNCIGKFSTSFELRWRLLLKLLLLENEILYSERESVWIFERKVRFMGWQKGGIHHVIEELFKTER